MISPAVKSYVLTLTIFFSFTLTIYYLLRKGKHKGFGLTNGISIRMGESQ